MLYFIRKMPPHDFKPVLELYEEDEQSAQDIDIEDDSESDVTESEEESEIDPIDVTSE